MNLSQFFQTKIITALRSVLGQDEVKAQSIGILNSICGHIIRPEGEADMVFRIYEDEHGIILKVGVNRTDVMNETIFIANPEDIITHVLEYVKEWDKTPNFGRLGMRADEFEAENGTLTGVDASQYDGLDEIESSDEIELEVNESMVQEIK